MNSSQTAAALLAVVPLLFAIPAVFPGSSALGRLVVASQAALGVVLLAACVWASGGFAPADVAPSLGLPGGDPGLRLDGVTLVIAGLVSLIAVPVARYSRSGFQGDARGPAIARWTAATLAWTTVLVLANHLGVVLLAWAGASLSVHGLLTRGSQRPRAQLAAREKFVLSRAAEGLVGVALAILAWRLGTVTFDGIAAALRTERGDGWLVVAASAVTLAAVLKTAQLPFHGWLTRIMEAPTPVSALLHAGVVNVGAVVLLRLAPLLEHAAPARWLLLAVGCATAVVAGFAADAQRSVKTRLAWSTVSQMGFMLVQCGLGAWPLVLLHLVAHSCYKAHAFLSAGSAIDREESLAFARPRRGLGMGPRLLGAAVGIVAALGVGGWIGLVHWTEPGEVAIGVVAGLGIATLLVETAARGAASRGVVGAAMVLGALVVAHAAFGGLLRPGATGPVAAAVLSATFAGAWVLRAHLDVSPDGGLARRLRGHLLGGFHLDHPLLALLSPRRTGDLA